MKKLNIITNLRASFSSKKLFILNKIFHLLLLLLFQHKIDQTFFISIRVLGIIKKLSLSMRKIYIYEIFKLKKKKIIDLLKIKPEEIVSKLESSSLLALF